jgi:hypothetical protein
MVGLIDLKEEREVYLVPQTLAHELVGEFLPFVLYTTINRQGVTRLWNVRVPDADGRAMEWHRSAAEAAERGMTHWIHVTANMSLGAYETRVSDSTAEPQWPEHTFNELLRIAFRDRLITSLDHPVVKRLRGIA